MYTPLIIETIVVREGFSYSLSFTVGAQVTILIYGVGCSSIMTKAFVTTNVAKIG